MTHYIKERYYEKLAEVNEHENNAIDESLFCHIDRTDILWAIGLINKRTYEFRLGTVLQRDSKIIKKIIKYHEGSGNNIITEGCQHIYG